MRCWILLLKVLLFEVASGKLLPFEACAFLLLVMNECEV